MRKVFEIFMIRVNLDRDHRPLRIDTPLAEGLYHREEFFVIDWVV